MLLSPRKNGLTSLIREVRVFKVFTDPEASTMLQGTRANALQPGTFRGQAAKG